MDRKNKKAGVAIHISEKNRLQNKKGGIKRDSEGHFIILNGRIHQEDINIVNMYAPNIGAPKYRKKILEGKIIVGDFNNPLSKIDRSYKQNINKDIAALNNALTQMDLTDVHSIFHTKKENTHSFQVSMELFQRQTT